MCSLLSLFVALDVSAIRFENGNWVLDAPVPGHCIPVTSEPRCEKTDLWGFRPGPTQTRLHSDRRWLEASNFVFR